jgi:hypothetical protein
MSAYVVYSSDDPLTASSVGFSTDSAIGIYLVDIKPRDDETFGQLIAALHAAGIPDGALATRPPGAPEFPWLSSQAPAQ